MALVPGRTVKGVPQNLDKTMRRHPAPAEVDPLGEGSACDVIESEAQAQAATTPENAATSPFSMTLMSALCQKPTLSPLLLE